MEEGELDSDDDVAGKGKSSWAQRITAHVAHLQALLNRREEVSELSPGDKKIAEKVKTHLTVARNAAGGRKTPLSMLTGARVDRAYSNVHKAEVKLLKLVPADEGELKWAGTVVLAQARQHLGPSDPRLVALEDRLKSNGQEMGPDLKELAIATLLAAHEAEEAERAQARSFRNVLLAAAIATSIVAALFIIWNLKDRSTISTLLCFSPSTGQVCPTGKEASRIDTLLVEGIGAGAAAMAGSLALRKIQGTNMPYSIPAMLILLRLPIGALSALFGIMLINGQVVPGLSNLDSAAQIAAWAIIFGIAQETVTRMIDAQGNKVLGNMRGPERDFEGGENT
ncbi:hypothetical protein E5082_29410 [Streptomyces griseoluteus]|uniref:Uncharacterized protein n=1 Tax=Streptomyces griseoluteus TaxID=29306 RepID=A0A4Z1D0Z4_STRGP|nr:hypothetical protein [Streptomyces griseoluteus]TGN75374.1 hypothetical protein E5082_29410 [Streptomyces griseoluteus]